MKKLISKIGKEKFFVLIAVTVLLIVVIAVSVAVTLQKSNINEKSYIVSNFGTIQGKFTDISINNEENAIEAVRDAAEILGLDNAAEELTINRTDVVENFTYYRLDQNYKGIPVYGSSFVVVVDEDGDARSITGNARDIDENISLIPIVTQDQINAAINSAFEEFENIVIPQVSEDMLVIYNFDETKESLLSYNFCVECENLPYNVIVDAENGDLIDFSPLFYLTNAEDSVRGIYIYDADNTYYYDYLTSNNALTIAPSNHPDAQRLLECISQTYDFFSEILGISGFNRKNGNVIGVCNSLFINNSGDFYGNNAMSVASSDPNTTFLVFGNQCPIDIDTVAHEYMHSVEQEISSLIYSYESGAIMEGYSDIFGELVEDLTDNNILDNSCDWYSENGILTSDRNMSNPNSTLNPSSYKGLYWQSSYLSSDLAKETFWDNGGVHQNNTVISYAAYLMTKDSQGCVALTNEELAKLWYNTLFLIPSNCTFSELREYMMLQAGMMGLPEQKQSRIELAFELVDIVPRIEEVDEDFNILISCPFDSEYHKNCRIEITKDSVKGEEVIISQNIENNSTSIALKKGNYTVRVFNKDTNTLLFVRNIKVNNKFTDKYVCFNIEKAEETEETTIIPETTLTPETTIIPEETTSPTPETTEHVHSYTSTDNAASCTKEVEKIYTCACGESYTETLPIIEHDYVNNVCSMCGLKKEVFSEGLEYKLSDDKTYYSLVGIGSCTDVDIIIPSVYEGLPVTEIEYQAFQGNNTIKSVVIPGSVKTIGIRAFNNVDSLENVTFNEGLVSIDYGAFSFCNNLTKIVLPESLRSVSQVFTYCPKLTDITLNEGLIEIGFGSFEAYSPFGNYNDAAFSFYGNGKYLGTKDNPYYAFMELADPFNNKNCEIHKDTKIIASDAFANGIIEELFIPDGVKAIGTYAFLSCPKLKTLKFGGVIENLSTSLFSDNANIVYNEYEGALYLGNDLNPYLILFSVKDKDKSSYTIHPDTKQIAGNAFRGCSALKSIVIPDSITVVGAYAFAECKALTEIVIPKSITKISTGMFYDCTAITEFTVPNHITSIGDYAFRGCSALTKVVMKNNVKYIGENAFAVCSKLKTIEYYGTEAEWNKVETGKNWNLSNQFLSPISVTVIEPVVLDAGASEGVIYTKSKDGKYYYVASLGLCTDTDIVISAKCNGLPVEIIIKNAFENCKNITSVTIPSSVKTIESSAFKNCTALRSVKLAEGVEKIAFLAFEGCTALEEVNIPSTCTLENAFVGCTSLKTLNIDPAHTSLKMIGDCLVSADNALILALGEQKIPEGAGIVRILSNAFYHAAIKEIVIPEGVRTIDLTAFDGCAELEKVTFPESLQSIGNAAFRDCKSLLTVYIPQNVNTLGINPFNGCTALTSINVDTENITYKSVDNCIIDIVGKKLVVGCATSNIPNDGSVTVIGQSSFANIDNIKNIEINSNITRIESGAFMGCHGIEKLVIPDSVTEIGSTVIYQMNSLTELVLGNGVISLDCISCSSLKKLQKLTIGNGITVIEKYDLMSCAASEIVLSKSIKKIEASAVCWCDNLTAIRYDGTVDEWNAIEKEAGWDNGTNNYTVYCSDGEIKKSN